MEYYERRLELSTKLPAKSLAIIIGNSVKFSSGSVFYDFQQDTDLYYLTGWLEPDTIMVIEKKGDNGADDVLLHMLVPPKTQRKNYGRALKVVWKELITFLMPIWWKILGMHHNI